MINLSPTTFTNHHEPCDILNAPFSKDELQHTIDNLKNSKAVGFDGITNEMVKNSPENVVNILLDFTDLCLQKELIPDSHCNDIINPIFKEGIKSDPNNYRGICIFSALTKVMMSMINTRVQKSVDEKNLISRNQIGFKKGSRTADHLLTLKSIVKKFVTLGKEKLYVCFVDFKKAFDSVWHIGLFGELRKLGLHGNLLHLIEKIYKKTKFAVRENDKITNFFKFIKSERQGCPLSPLLFNLYINDIFNRVDKISKSPIQICNNESVNALMFADDLILIAKTEEELQRKINTLSDFCKEKKLEINEIMYGV